MIGIRGVDDIEEIEVFEELDRPVDGAGEVVMVPVCEFLELLGGREFAWSVSFPSLEMTYTALPFRGQSDLLPFQGSTTERDREMVA